jgi:hypothetical protein
MLSMLPSASKLGLLAKPYSRRSIQGSGALTFIASQTLFRLKDYNFNTVGPLYFKRIQTPYIFRYTSSEGLHVANPNIKWCV